MSLLTEASLIVTPNAYNVGKLYSVIPNTTLGDMTVVRATTATRVNSAGLIESMAINVPRLDYTGGGCPSILVEPLRTNVILQSETFDNASWQKSVVGINTSIGTSGIESNVANAPSGTLTADRVNFNPQIDLDLGLNQLYASAVATQSFVSSIYVKGEGSNIGKQIRLRIKRSLGGSFVTVDTTITLTSDWVRITSSALTLLALNTGVQYIISSNDATNALIWGAQLEQGSNATSYIPTTISALARNADVISKTGISSLIGQTEGTIFVEANLTANTEQRRIITIGTEFQRIMFWTLGTTLYANFNTIGVAIGTFPIGTAKIALGYTIGASSTTYSIKLNNNTLITGTANAAPSSLSAIYLGSTVSGTLILNDRIESATLFPTRLTDPQLENLTAI
jgi:hypothetical protein